MKTNEWVDASRLIGRLLILVAMLTAWAAAQPARTMVQDTLYRADGTAATGTVTVRWQGFNTAGGQAVAAGMLMATTDANGGIAIPLVANVGSTPAGGYYQVVIKLDDGTTSQEQWVVPVAATVTLGVVRAQVVPQNVAAQFVSRDFVTEQMDALATVASTGSYTDLINRPAPVNLQAPGPIGSTTPSSAVFTSVNNTYWPQACGSSAPPSWCSGSDIGAWTMAAYNNVCGSGCELDYYGMWQQTTPINFNINGQCPKMKGVGGVGNATFVYTPTSGTALKYDCGGVITASGYGPENLTIWNGQSLANFQTQPTGTTAVGLELGTTNGSNFFTWVNNSVFDFATNIKFDNGGTHELFLGGRSQTLNGGKVLSLPDNASFGWEQVKFDGVMFNGGAGSVASAGFGLNCMYLGEKAGAVFEKVSIDGCQVIDNGGSTFIAPHFESFYPNGTQPIYQLASPVGWAVAQMMNPQVSLDTPGQTWGVPFLVTGGYLSVSGGTYYNAGTSLPGVFLASAGYVNVVDAILEQGFTATVQSGGASYFDNTGTSSALTLKGLNLTNFTTPATAAVVCHDTAGNITDAGCPTALIVSPPTGSTLTGSRVTFGFTPQTNSSGYYLWIGSTPGGHDIVNDGPTTNLSFTETVPTSGATIYATLLGSVGGTNPTLATATYTEATAVTPLMNGTAAVGTSVIPAKADHVHPTDTSRAPVASPTFTGTITTPLTSAGVITTNSSGVLSSSGKSLTGSGAAIPTGPLSTTAGHLATFASTGGDIQDGGIAASALMTTSTSVAASQLPALTGDVTSTAGTVATTVGKINGLAVPVSANVVGTNSSGQVATATSHNVSAPANCIAASGSPTAYTCTTSPTFTPAAGDHIQFEADVASTGSATLAVNGQTPAIIHKQGGSANIVANDLLAGHWISATFDGTYWQLEGQLGNASSGSSSTTATTISALPSASSNTNKVLWVNDSTSLTSCANGDGTNLLACISNGTNWVPQSGLNATNAAYAGGSILNAFGDSITYGAGASVPANSFIQQLGNLFGLTVNNQALGGSVLYDQEIPISTTSISATSRNWFMIGVNDVGWMSGVGTLGNSVANYWQGSLLGAHIWMLTQNKTMGQGGGFTTTGTWVVSSNFPTFGMQSATASATATTHLYGTAVYVVISTAIADASATQFNVSVDGVVYGPYSAQQTTKGSCGGASSCAFTASTYSFYAVRIAGLAEQSHTVVVTRLNSDSTPLRVEFATSNANQLTKTGPFLYAGTSYLVSGITGTEAQFVVLNNMVRASVSALQSDGLGAQLIDVQATCTTSTGGSVCDQADGIHPNDGGHTLIANAIFTQTNAFSDPFVRQGASNSMAAKGQTQAQQSAPTSWGTPPPGVTLWGFDTSGNMWSKTGSTLSGPYLVTTVSANTPQVPSIFSRWGQITYLAGSPYVTPAITKITSGTVSSYAASAPHPSMATFTTAATANSAAYLSEFTGDTGWMTQTSLQAGARYWLLNTATVRAYAIGFSTTPNTMTGDIGVYVGWRYSTAAGDTNWMCVGSTNLVTQNTVSSGIAVDTSSEHLFEVREDISAGKWHFYYDGSLVSACESGITLWPTQTAIYPMSGIQTLAASSVAFRAQMLSVMASK